jgi:hypothetical protein
VSQQGDDFGRQEVRAAVRRRRWPATCSVYPYDVGVVLNEAICFAMALETAQGKCPGTSINR